MNEEERWKKNIDETIAKLEDQQEHGDMSRLTMLRLNSLRVLRESRQ